MAWKNYELLLQSVNIFNGLDWNYICLILSYPCPPKDEGGLKVGDQKASKIYDIQAFRKKGDQPLPVQVSGETANLSGIYRLEHSNSKHPVPKELVILKGSKFPSCPACSEPITFRLSKQADEITEDPDFE